MAARTPLILMVFIFLLGGCFGGERRSRIEKSSGVGGDAQSRVIEHLKNQKLPALKSIEPWENDYGPGIRLTTEHYEVLTTLLDPLMLRQVPGYMEAVYRQYQNQLDESIWTRRKFKVYIFNDRRQWEVFTKEFTGEQAELYLKIKAGAYYLNGVCAAYNIGRDRTFSVLGHEGWHQFNSRHFEYRLPSWLDEGVAMLFEVSRYENGQIYFEPQFNGYRLVGLKNTLAAGKMIPLARLIAMNPGEAMTSETDDATEAFYSQAYALVRFLREEAYGKRLADYQRLLSDGLDGRWPLSLEYKRIAANRNFAMRTDWNSAIGSQLFRRYFNDNDDLKTIEKEYIAFCRKIVYHVQVR